MKTRVRLNNMSYMKFTLVFLLGCFLIVGCGDKPTLEKGDDKDSKDNYTLKQQIEDISGLSTKVNVSVIKLATGSIVEELSITGELVPEKSIIIKPLMDGRIQFLRNIEVGDIVEEGEIIAKIDDRDIEDEIDQQKKQIEITKEKIKIDEYDLEQRKQDLENDKKLLEKGFLTQTEYNRTELALKNGEITLRQSRISLEQEESRLSSMIRKREKVNIEIPFKGMVVQASHLTGNEASGLLNEKIMAMDGTLVGTGTNLFGVISQEGYVARCMVSGKDKGRIKIGQKCKVTVFSHKSVDVNGKIIDIAHLQDAKTHAYKVWIELEKMDETFASGLFVRTEVELARNDDAIVVERKYVKEKDNQQYVQIVVDGLVKSVDVETGIKQGKMIEVVSGVKAGDMLIASDEVLADDQAVKPVEIEEE